jgi:hypothetical protein
LIDDAITTRARFVKLVGDAQKNILKAQLAKLKGTDCVVNANHFEEPFDGMLPDFKDVFRRVSRKVSADKRVCFFVPSSGSMHIVLRAGLVATPSYFEIESIVRKWEEEDAL